MCFNAKCWEKNTSQSYLNEGYSLLIHQDHHILELIPSLLKQINLHFLYEIKAQMLLTFIILNICLNILHINDKYISMSVKWVGISVPQWNAWCHAANILTYYFWQQINLFHISLNCSLLLKVQLVIIECADDAHIYCSPQWVNWSIRNILDSIYSSLSKY